MQVVELEVEPEDGELAADALWQAGASAVTEEVIAGGRLLLRADVEVMASLDPRWRATAVEPDTEAHLDAWRSFARPVVVGPLRLQPAWLELDAAGLPTGGEVVVWLDPGRAFGSGSHPSTRLALGALVERRPASATVLDIGCGSGVLAAAAALLGARSVRAVDLDPEAVRATADNAARNDVEVEVAVGSAADVEGTFDLVVANIGAGVLIDHADAIAARVRPGGHAVLAGFLADRADDVASAYGRAVEVARTVEDGWAALVLRG